MADNHGGSVTTQSGQGGVRLTNLLRQLWSSNITYNLAVLLLKDSLLFQYLRFSIDVGYRRACWALGTIITAYGVAALFVSIFSCQPISYSWNSNVPGGKCIDFLTFWLFNASFNSATDIIVCVLPTPVLRALRLPRKQLGILACIFLLGAFVCIASIVRLFAVYSATVNNQNDPAIAIWSAVEVNIGIICACLPSLRHPVTQLWPRILARHQRLTAHEASSESPTSIGLTTRPKYPDPSVKCLDDDLSRSSSLQSDVEIPPISQPTQPGAGAREIAGVDASKPHSVIGTHDQAAPGSTTDAHVFAPTHWKSSSPTISTVTELDEPTDEPDSEPADSTPDTARPLPLPQLLTAPSPAGRPLGPRPPTLQKQIEPPSPAPALAPPPPVVTRSHKRSKSKRMGQSCPVVPLACIPESSASNTPDSEDGYQDGAERDRHQSQDEDQHDNDLALSRTSSSHLNREPTIVIPPQQYSRPQPPGSPSSTYTSTSITTVSSNRSSSHLMPWDPEWDGRASYTSKTYSYEILGGPQALESTSSDSASVSASVSASALASAPQSTLSPTAASRPTSPLAKVKSMAISKIAAAVTSHDRNTLGMIHDSNQGFASSSASPSGSKQASPSKFGPRPAPAPTSRPGSARPDAGSGLGLGLGLGVGLGVDLRSSGKSKSKSNQTSNPTSTPTPRSGIASHTTMTPSPSASVEVVGTDKYTREQARRDLERARRKQREHERELERIQEREMQKQKRKWNRGGDGGQSDGESGGERPRGPREMR
ncbi:hypothetical protein A1O3_03978 [Capronia epimyces CBS 606.96]|uniref:Rhodopsin domain-containing protein n=1 Tax=Capronia epimyces CBS 606.96 TaxID=1182542 RepID=W9YCP5_9EURO|nr:uncharacterized protein A1O3_03978 [Capronia epimyces CBS 606.96]EXJ87021.1 hypothetical protein A1O3_03978 [Capronia epimyces CBS 606.96]